MNAPERIYIDPKVDPMWDMNERYHESDIEYTRTDAFIDKAAKWINEYTSLSEKLVIENFRNYMEGE